MYNYCMRIKIKNAQSLDEFNITLQIILAYLQDNGVDSVDRCNLYFSAKKPSGNDKVLPAADLDAFEIIPEKPNSGGAVGRKPARRYKK